MRGLAKTDLAIRWLLAAGAVVVLAQIELVFDRPINWDEFYHLSQTHAFVDGRLTEALQVFYARAFFWIALIPGDAIDQLRIARAFMMGFELFTVWAIYAMAARFTERVPALLAALTYLTAGYVFQHGFSYRADPMAAAFLMGALWILLVSRLEWKSVLGAALLVGLAVLTTIKVVFYAPAFAGVAWLRWRGAEEPIVVLTRLAGFTFASAIFAALLCGLTILSMSGVGDSSAERTVASSAGIVFSEGLLPRWPYLLGLFASAPVLALLVLTAPLEIGRTNSDVDRRIALWGLFLPLTCVILYRNSFPYFYAFILPPTMVAAAVAAPSLLARIRLQALAALLALNATVVSYLTPRSVLATQREVITAAHEIFPQPVAYFDFPGMIVDFPKANFFMSTWGMKRYWENEVPSFHETMSRETVPLLVLNQDSLERNQTNSDPAWELKEEDAMALREGFIEHWGPLWVAGHRFPENVEAGEFQIFAAGSYTLEGGQTRIDGHDYAPGGVLELDRGIHRFKRLENREAALRWGDHLHRPTTPFTGGPVVKDF